VFVQYTKIFTKNLSILLNQYTTKQLLTIKKVIKLIECKKLEGNDFDNHILGKYSSKKYTMFDCHPLYYDDKDIDLVLLYAYDKSKKKVIYYNIGTHKEVFN
jgi:mRNA-degrading endonuclease YafQ of YafQ-DinJ toxin-antitoxin module